MTHIQHVANALAARLGEIYDLQGKAEGLNAEGATKKATALAAKLKMLAKSASDGD